MKLSLGFDCVGAPGIVAGLRRLLEGHSSTEFWMIARCAASDGTLLQEFERVMVHTRELWVGERSVTPVLVVSLEPRAVTDGSFAESDEYWTHYWLLPSYCPQGLEYAASQLSAYLFWRAAHHQAAVFRLQADSEPPRPLAQAPALRRAWHAVTNLGIVIPTSAAVVCATLAKEQLLAPQDALRIMEDSVLADGALRAGETRYEPETWDGQFQVLSV